MRALVLLGACILPGLLTHRALYGWHRAPRDVVHLDRRQWKRVAMIAAVPVGIIIALVTPLRRLALTTESEWGGVFLISSFIALCSITYGMAPSFHDEDPDHPSAPAAPSSVNGREQG